MAFVSYVSITDNLYKMMYSLITHKIDMATFPLYKYTVNTLQIITPIEILFMRNCTLDTSVSDEMTALDL